MSNVTNCPDCGRKLLSQASARCNWCGHMIEDPAYQAEADAERAAYFSHQQERDAQGIAAVQQMNVYAYDPAWSGGNPFWRRNLNGRRTGPGGQLTPNLPGRPAGKARPADVEAQMRLEAELGGPTQPAGSRQVSSFGFPAKAVQTTPQQPTQEELKAETETSEEDTNSRFKHLEM